MTIQRVTIPVNRDMRRYARTHRPRAVAIRCTCPTCHGVDWLRRGDYLAAHPTVTA